MLGETINFDEAAQAAAADDDEKSNDRSSIVFPYLDLDTAVEVAKAVHGRAGFGVCALDELAAEMKQSLSGAFRQKTQTAKIFELVDKEGRNAVKLTALGQRLVNPDEERAARVDSFLCVPLYNAVYEKYRGHLLPPVKALEREMLSLGVAPKQTDNARRAFERSARQAGFYEAGDNRLVKPRLDPSPGQTEAGGAKNQMEWQDTSSSEDDTKKSGGGGDGLDLDPLLIELLKKIPGRGEDWPANRRLRWFKTFAMNVSEIYDDPDKPIDLSIEITKAAGD